MPQLLDVAIGTIFVFLLFSLIVSALNEYVLSLFDQRAKFLRMGLAKMFGENLVKNYKKYIPGGLVGGHEQSVGKEGNQLLSHGLINAFSRAEKGDGSGTPSYIPAGAFVTALLDILDKPQMSTQWDPAQVGLLTKLVAGLRACN